MVMKKFLVCTFILVLSLCSFAQVYKNAEASKFVEGANLVRFKESTKVPCYVRLNKDFNLSINDFDVFSRKLIKSNNSEFRLDKIQETKIVNKNKKAKKIYRYSQLLNGYPIEFTTWIVHVEDDIITSMNGDIIESPEVDVAFELSEEQALENALKYINAEVYMWELENEEALLKRILKNDEVSYFPKATKVIVPDKMEFEGSTLRAAYKFDIFSNMPYDRKEVYVDAKTGKILFDLPLIHMDGNGLANTQYSGTREIFTSYDDTENFYYLKDETRGLGIETLNCNHDTIYNAATNFTDNNNIWNEVEDNMPELDKYALDAHFATTKTYDYLLNIHNRNSIDDYGHPLVSYVNFNLIKYGHSSNVNAFWNGFYMSYGIGGSIGEQTVTPLTTIDVCAHEITHGLTSNTANLRYRNEPGALNEAFSDIFGTAVEFFTVPDAANWTIGENSGYTMRSMSNPKEHNQPDTYKGNFWYSGTEDSGGVHINSGVLNYWFYLICEGGSGTNDLGKSYEVAGIGLEKAEQIAFKLLTEYLSTRSNYNDAYFYGIQAAAEIFGDCSPEVTTVGNAFYAVGIAPNPYADSVVADFNADVTNHCEAPLRIAFNNLSQNGLNFLWDFGDGNTSTAINPVHNYEDFGEYSVSLYTSSNGCGEDTNVKEKYIKLLENGPCLHIMKQFALTTVEACEGFVYGPGGVNSDYFSGANAVFTIYSPNAKKIELRFILFDIVATSSTGCNNNNISFYDGPNINSPRINSTYYCNNIPVPDSISSSGEYISIRFNNITPNSKNNFGIHFKCSYDNSSDIINSELNNIYISPNPTDDFIIIHNVDHLLKYSISIFDVYGKSLINIENNNKINCSQLSEGLYYMKLTSNDEQKTLKFIIQR
jgi:Zn-dependent metalloprotease